MSNLLVAILALCGIIVVPLVLFLTIKEDGPLKTLSIVLCVVYCIILAIGVWTKVSTTGGLLKISLDYSGEWINKPIKWGFKNTKIKDALINLVMLVPIGLVFSFNHKGKLAKQIVLSLALGLVVGIVIEAGQFVLPVKRSVQLSDVVFNGISCGVGAIINKFYLFLRQKRFS